MGVPKQTVEEVDGRVRQHPLPEEDHQERNGGGKQEVQETYRRRRVPMVIESMNRWSKTGES